MDDLEKPGIKDTNITLLYVTGMHRKSPQEEKITKLGVDILKR
jgi:nickel-dependent lactate racemase